MNYTLYAKDVINLIPSYRTIRLFNPFGRLSAIANLFFVGQRTDWSDLMSPSRCNTPELEYADDCYRYLVKREKSRLYFHCRSPQLTYRNELILRMEVLCDHHKFSTRVKHLAIYILDFFMDNFDICEDRLELTLICSLMIAAKVDENDIKIPKYSQLFSQLNQYSLSETNQMEFRILQFFDWIFMTPTTATYIDYFYEKFVPPTRHNSHSKEWIEHYLDKSLAAIRFYQFHPSLIAAAIIYCVREKLKLAPFWTKAAHNLSKYSVNELKGCVDELTKSEIRTTTITRVSSSSLLNDSGIDECQ